MIKQVPDLELCNKIPIDVTSTQPGTEFWSLELCVT